MSSSSSSSSSGSTHDRRSSRTLDEVGVENVLHAMVEQRRRASEPAACEVADYEGAPWEGAPLEYEETPRSQRVPVESDAFLKAR
jgi:hypothetical protein